VARQHDPVEASPHCFRIKVTVQQVSHCWEFAFFSRFFPVAAKKNDENRLTPAQVHQITRDLAAAASSAAPAGTPVKLRQGAFHQATRKHGLPAHRVEE